MGRSATRINLGCRNIVNNSLLTMATTSRRPTSTLVQKQKQKRTNGRLSKSRGWQFVRTWRVLEQRTRIQRCLCCLRRGAARVRIGSMHHAPQVLALPRPLGFHPKQHLELLARIVRGRGVLVKGQVEHTLARRAEVIPLTVRRGGCARQACTSRAEWEP